MVKKRKNNYKRKQIKIKAIDKVIDAETEAIIEKEIETKKWKIETETKTTGVMIILQ